MKKITVKIKTPLPINRSRLLLNNHIIEKPGLLHILKKRPVLIGKMDNDIFKVTTVDTPPMEINGSLIKFDNGSVIELFIKVNSMGSSMMGLGLGLGYTFLFAILIINMVESPTNIWIYLNTLIAIPAIYFVMKVLIYLNNPKPNPNLMINRLVKLFNGEIIEKKNYHKT